MKRMTLGLLTACSMLALGGAPALADYQLRILHTNDVHDRVESVTKYNNSCDAKGETEGKCFGGYARLATAIRDARAQGGNTVVLDAGDQFQGSLFYTTYKGDLTAELMGMVGYDAMTIGNHEFDDGPENLVRFIENNKTPIVSSNLVAGPASPLHDKVKPYTILEAGGQKIGVIGLTTEETPEVSSIGPDLTFMKSEEALRIAVAKLKLEGIDKIIVLGHDGSYRDFEIAKRVDGIDVIVGGHDHLLFSNTDKNAQYPYPVVEHTPNGDPVLIVQAYAYSRYLGDLNVTFNDDGVPVKWQGDPIALDSSVKQAPDVLAAIDAKRAPVDAVRNQLVGEFSGPADGSRETCRAQECAMGDLVADAMLAKAGEGFQIAIQNGGGLRASIDQGQVNMGEVMTVLPFQNTIATFKLSGKNVVASLEHGVSGVAEGKGQFPQVAGLKFDLDLAAAEGARVSNVMVMEDGAYSPIQDDKLYGVVSNDFMRRGGDGYVLFRDNGVDAYDYGPNLEDAVAEYIAANSPMTPATQGRIILK
ncbi:bifunctional metallophosphatase/5'-nucleotidase [Thalassospira marina]|uniref:Multifunctional 2',3'-cyclic-nucleotide 2'-phosphodiesterase/5'-nucleotidase/3'-nucleotidase n=1 Tax=Thalassospira marina TaxID=2048283 RepID=A0ABM6Q8B2_9PROT|nr:bifunctional metallophosphatase/5'-nucleotidase [Thalassospira marina]AUG52791.1 multifunctional 2',3'-cyclic-nucleotide 2'-phosphodiesterase/5'-nucleotidase/3'-nucleotidase [Thalassospira marina]